MPFLTMADEVSESEYTMKNSTRLSCAQIKSTYGGRGQILARLLDRERSNGLK
jgi:hypothetical protein